MIAGGGPADLVLAASLFLACFWAALIVVRRCTRAPLPFAGCLALCTLVFAEAAVVNALSPFRAVTRTGLLLSNLLLLAAAVAFAPLRFRAESARLLRLLRPRGRWSWLALTPLAALAALSAGRFVPNNWDSMTYHLARVSHWMANRSVAAYPTGIPRQNALAAGPEYLLLLLQGVSRSDRLDAFLQLFGWILVVLAAPALARLAGAPRRSAWLAGVFAGAAPMAILQASSTQTDLVASVVALALVAASLPFLHGSGARTRRFRGVQVALLALALATAPMVKATALFVTAPLLALALTVSLRRAWRGARLPLVWSAAAGTAAAAVLVPELLRRNPVRDVPDDVARHSYLFTGEWPDRLANVGRGLSHHLWAPTTLVPQEDLAGNPAQMLLLLVALGVGTVAGRHLPRRLRLALPLVAGGWVLLHVLLRDNLWLSRIQLPVFVLGSVAVGALPGVRRGAVQAGVALSLVGFGAWTGFHNQLRPPLEPALPQAEWAYFVGRPGSLEPELGALETVAGSGCRRLGLILGGDTYDYPLTWIGRRLGIEARHVQPGDDWSCAVFSDGEKPGPGFAPAFLAPDEQTGSPRTFLYLRLPAAEVSSLTAGSASR